MCVSGALGGGRGGVKQTLHLFESPVIVAVLGDSGELEAYSPNVAHRTRCVGGEVYLLGGVNAG